MSHISYSELKNWATCPHYHKLINIEKKGSFNGNEYTAFGSALHEACEKNYQDQKKEFDMYKHFQGAFVRELDQLDKYDPKLTEAMDGQAEMILEEVVDSLEDYFGPVEVVTTEEQLYIPIDEFEDGEYKFKGYIDLVVKDKKGKVHIVDWKTCSWGWDSRKKSDPMITYQLTLYKHYWAKKHSVDPKEIETHFALLKRTAKSKRVEFFRVTSGPKKTSNAVNLMLKALYNISKKFHIKNKLACKSQYGYCEFYNTEHCR